MKSKQFTSKYNNIRYLHLRKFYFILSFQKVLLYSLEFSLNGDGDDCNNEYLEILDGEEGDAISIGKYDFSTVNPAAFLSF